jgi:hypothetical protein
VDLRERRELNNGFGEALARAFELVATPGIFAAAGYGLDRLFGLHFVLTWVLGMVALAGMFIRMYYGYEHEMQEHEAAGPWARKRS